MYINNKGIRNKADLEYEETLDKINRSQVQGIKTRILGAKPELAHVSSSAVKALQKEHGFTHEYVPLYVKQKLEAKISGQYIVGVTGEIGSGKSYISSRFEELGKEKGIEVHNIELDNIGHQILSERSEPAYQEVRSKIAEEFGTGVRQPDGMIDRKGLGEIVFNDTKKLAKLNEIMQTPLMVRLRRELSGKKGTILFNAALIAESDMGYLCNNNVVLVTVDKESQERRLKERNLTQEQIEKRLASQYNLSQKHRKIIEAIMRDRQGNMWILDNSDNANPNKIVQTFDDVVKVLECK